jgi:hypothetical protein
VDYKIGAVYNYFLELEDRMSNQRLHVKPRVMGLFDFSGCRVEQTASHTSLSHDAYIQDLSFLKPTATFSDLRVARGKLAWISNERSYVAVSINRLTQVSDRTMCLEHIRLHNKVVIPIQGEKLIRVLNKVDSKEAVLLVFTDAGFASNADFTSQLRHVIVLWSRCTHAAVVLEAKSTNLDG